jgi:hypothetical protein
MAYGGSGYSWWCGTFDYDYDGGYGDMWDDRLNLPAVDLSSALYPILTFAYRHDSERGYDNTWVEAESLGVFRSLNRGYEGVAPWTDIGMYGYVLSDYDNPFVARFRFLSDVAWSDEDGLYLSEGGAFACDNIKIYDYWTGLVSFYDSGGAATMPIRASFLRTSGTLSTHRFWTSLATAQWSHAPSTSPYTWRFRIPTRAWTTASSS